VFFTYYLQKYKKFAFVGLKIKLLITNNISDSKRQQTTTVDYKRLINGLVLTSVVTLHRQTDGSTNSPTG
jgi:hypothetical protein